MSEIESHDDLAFSTDGSGEDVPVLGIIGYAILNRLEPLDQGFWEMDGDLFSPMSDKVCGPAELFERAIRFFENPVTPIWQVNPGRLGQPQWEFSPKPMQPWCHSGQNPKMK